MPQNFFKGTPFSDGIGLFPDSDLLRTMIIARRKDFETLFEGFSSLKAITYVASPELLLEFFDKRGYGEVEILVGENLSEPYRQTLAQKGPDVATLLAERVLDGTLRVWVPSRTIHTKLYLLGRPDMCRVIVTSANLTETARSAKNQINYAWYADLPHGHPWLLKTEADFSKHLEGCELFMGDLAELVKQGNGENRKEIIEFWLKGTTANELENETKKVLNQITLQALSPQQFSQEAVFTVTLPDAPAARREIERYLAPLNPSITGREARLNAPGFIRYVQDSQGIPLLRVDREKKELRIGFNGTVEPLAQTPAEPAVVAKSLEHIEEYISMVEEGQSPDPRFAKTSMFEALLALFCAPFANEYLKAKRSHYGAIDSRGPRFLYIYGPSQNGKSTFLRFVLKLISGHSLEPLNGGDFTKRKILGAASIGTAFPLVFDDLVLSQRWGLFEETLKSYWEIWWRPDCPAPQIVIASNMFALREWAKSRIKRVDFDVHFAATGAGKEKLARLFAFENRLFTWFSRLYLDYLEEPKVRLEDELDLGRKALSALYQHSGRALPDYFPAEPIEKLYDPGQRAWGDLVYRLKKGRIGWEGDRASVSFADDLQYYEIKEYESYLPQTIKHRRRGKALVIESPKEFRAWLKLAAPKPRGLFERIFK
ncbi:MAG: hypothetical protein AAB091_00150 [Elusimicrobiota bacterium]